MAMAMAKDGSAGLTSTTSSSLTTLDDLIPLPICNAPFTGRSEELKVIQNAYDRVRCENASAEVVLIHGVSGAGKSSLVDYLIKRKKKGREYFCAGKCSSRLYGGIVDATTQLCFAIHDSQDDLPSIRSNLVSNLTEEEIHLFQEVVPAIEFVVPCTKRESFDTNEQSFNRFMGVYRKFLQQVCSENVLVLCLDDLQWADSVTRQLIDSIVRDSKLTNFLFIGSYREDEINFELTSDAALQVTRVHLGPLNVDNVNVIVSKIIGRPQEETRALSAVVHRKTAGNVYFVIQYLEMLHREGLLQFNKMSHKWEWESTKVAARTAVSNNVVELLVQKIESISPQAQMVLIVAACLGHTFSVKVLECILSQESTRLFSLLTYSKEVSMNKDDIHKALNTAIRAGLIEELSSTHCKFSHDRVQQSAYSILPSGEQGRLFESHLGEVLLQLSYEEDSEEWMLFCAIDLLSKRDSSSLSNTEMAQLCLEAATRASRKAAFQSAAGYADNGLKRIGQDWDVKYDLWHELANLSCEMHYASGKLAASKEMADAILQKSRRVQDCFRSYKVIMDIFTTTEDYQGAVSKGCSLLKDLGVVTPRKPGLLSVISHLKRAQHLLKGRKASDLDKLPRMENPTMEQALELLGKTSYCAYHIDDAKCLCVCLNMIMFIITLEHGIGEDSPYAFAAFGMVMAHQGKWTEAYEFGALAMRTLELPGMKNGIAKTTVVVHAFLHYLKKPIQDSLEPFMRGFTAGMEVGDLVQACVCLQNRTRLGIFCGMHLVDHKREGIEYCEFLREYKQLVPLKNILPSLQLTDNLLGNSDDPTKLRGAFMDEDKLDNMLSQRQYWWFRAHVHYARMALLCTLGEFEKAEKDRKGFSASNSAAAPTFSKLFDFFFSGLTCLVMAGKGKRFRYYKRQAKYYQKELRIHAKTGCVNAVPMLSLFEAEELSLKDTNGSAVDKYNQCIAFASRSGFRLIRGIACERAGEYMLKCGEVNAASDYLQQAFNAFSDIGAVAKQGQMARKYGNAVTFSASISPGSHSSTRLKARSVKLLFNEHGHVNYS